MAADSDIRVYTSTLHLRAVNVPDLRRVLSYLQRTSGVRVYILDIVTESTWLGLGPEVVHVTVEWTTNRKLGSAMQNYLKAVIYSKGFRFGMYPIEGLKVRSK